MKCVKKLTRVQGIGGVGNDAASMVGWSLSVSAAAGLGARDARGIDDVTFDFDLVDGLTATR